MLLVAPLGPVMAGGIDQETRARILRSERLRDIERGVQIGDIQVGSTRRPGGSMPPAGAEAPSTPALRAAGGPGRAH